MAARIAPFETFFEHNARITSNEPYNEAFLGRCRREALRYDKMDKILRDISLSDLQKSIPLHFQGKVFDGISFVDVLRDQH